MLVYRLYINMLMTNKTIKLIEKAIKSSTSSREKRKYLLNRIIQICKENEEKNNNQNNQE